MDRLSVCFFLSGEGTTLRTIIDAVKLGILNINITGAIINKNISDCLEITEYCNENNINLIHLERFNKKTKVGAKVKQGEIIAYVGDSGRATGTHLHFEFWQGTKRTDPVKVQLPSAQPISKEELDKFLSELEISLQKLAEYNQTDNA